MARGLIGYDDPCSPWAISVAEAVEATANRATRWRGLDIVVHAKSWTPRDPAEDLRMLDSPLFLTEDLADVVRDARLRDRVRDPAKLVQATAYVTSQAASLSSPEYDNIGAIHRPEAYLDTGLGDVWTQERLAEVWPRTESATVLPAEQVPGFAFAGRNPEAAQATRALMTEVVRQQGGTAPGPDDYAALSDWMLSVKPDRRWGEVMALLPHTDTLPERDRWQAETTLYKGFEAAVDQGKPELAADAVRTVAAKVDPVLRKITHDAALAAAGAAVSTGTGTSTGASSSTSTSASASASASASSSTGADRAGTGTITSAGADRARPGRRPAGPGRREHGLG
ncbi:MAG TPA: hypothetical protein VFH76_13670 [Kribbella sp.]|nr:hypothetical protein [Kribbella sp.]